MHAFISHSSKDSEFACRLVSLLEAEGIKCWIAPRDIPAGSDYATEILQALQRAQCLALIFTEHANTSVHVLREVERAISFRRPILPLKTADLVPEGSFAYFLATIHCPKLPPASDGKAAAAYARVIGDFVAGKSGSPDAFRPRATSSEEAYERLWQMATDLELKYREACRKKIGDDEWIGVDALQVTINEFLIANRNHFPEQLRIATQAYSRAVERLAKAAKAGGDSDAAADFAITTSISGDLIALGKELFEANQEFERCSREFDGIFKTSRKPKGFWQRLFQRG